MSKKLFKDLKAEKKKTKVYNLTEEQIRAMKDDCMKKAIDEALKYAKILATNCYLGILEDTEYVETMPSVNEFARQYDSLIESYENKILDDEDLFNAVK